jgi:hypothetical protein
MPTITELKPLSAFIQEAIEYPFEIDALEHLPVTTSVLECLIEALQKYEGQFIGDGVESICHKT